MVKLLQMATSIMGYRLHAGDIPDEILSQRPDRYEAFAPYTVEAWGRGLLDATIPGREVFPESQAEKAQWLALAKDLPPWGLRELGISEEDIAAEEEAKAQRAAEQLAMFAMAAPPGAAGVAEEPAEEPVPAASNGRVAIEA